MEQYGRAVEAAQQLMGVTNISYIPLATSMVPVFGGLGNSLRPPRVTWTDDKAEAQADELLCARLTPVEATMWRQTGRLMRPSRLWPGVEYLIRRNDTVAIIERGEVKQWLCVVVAKEEPEADRMMTILDLIESDERRLWEMAVATPGSGTPVNVPPLPTHARQADPLARLYVAAAIGAGVGLGIFGWLVFGW